MVQGRWRKVDPFIGAAVKASRARHELDRGLETVDSATLTRFLDSNAPDFQMTSYWLQYVVDSRPTTNVEEVVAEIGRKARAGGVKLAVVYIPESRWLTSRYTPEQREQFLRAVRALEKEATFCDIEWFTRGGGDNRLFVNRYMLADFPYDIYDDAAAAREWIKVEQSQRQWQLFDADHMNAAGAEKFTRSTAPKLRAWIEQADAGAVTLR
jgi:hypothetical protein